VVPYKIKYKNGEKMFLSRKRGIPTAQAPSERSEESDLEVASSSGNIYRLDATQQLPFMILDET